MSKNILNIVCLILLLASVVCLFVPCWAYEADEGTVAVSVVEYISDPGSHRTLTRLFQDYTGEKKLTTRTALPLFVLLVGGIAAIVGGALKFNTAIPALCAVCLGTLGLYVYLTNVPVMLGTMRIPQMIIYGLMFVSGVVQLVLMFRRKYLIAEA